MGLNRSFDRIIEMIERVAGVDIVDACIRERKCFRTAGNKYRVLRSHDRRWKFCIFMRKKVDVEFMTDRYMRYVIGE